MDKRLTARTDDGIIYVPSETGERSVGYIITQRRLDDILRKLAAYEDLDEQQMLFKLPCKPYTKGYLVYAENKSLEEVIVLSFKKTQYYESAILKFTDGTGTMDMTLEEFNKCVFLNKSDAEAKIYKKD